MRFQTDRHFNQFSTALSFRPTQLAGLVLWVRADLGVTGTTEVTAWADQSGTGNNLVKGATGPALTASVAALGGKPGITFDGTAKTILKDPLVGVVAQPNTIVAAVNLTDQSAQRLIVDGNAGNRQIFDINANVYNLQAPTSLSNSVTPATGAHTAMGIFNGASSQISTDGAHVVTGAGGANSLGACYVGSNFAAGTNWIGDIAEVMIYSRALSAAEQTQVQAYLKARYGTP